MIRTGSSSHDLSTKEKDLHSKASAYIRYNDYEFFRVNLTGRTVRERNYFTPFFYGSRMTNGKNKKNEC